MRDHRTLFPLEQMARTLGISRSGYYNFIKRPPSGRELENEKLTQKIKAIFEASHETYGSPRIHAELLEEGIPCSRRRVARLMRHNNIQAKMYKKFVKTTKRSEKSFYSTQDLVQQDFSTSLPNTVWVADISFVWISNRWAYLAIVLDLFSRKVVGMTLKNTMKTSLILEALNQALLLRRPPEGLIHHSDLGSQYTSHALHKLAEKHGIRLSHGKTGSAYDNAVMESFFHTLKTELTYFKNYQSLEEAKMDIFNYIFTFYNNKRRHSTLNYQTPNQYEHHHQQRKFISVRSV
jgi:transposase InsO family protein